MKKYAKIIMSFMLLGLMPFGAVSCGTAEEETPAIKAEDYKTVTIDGKTWMAENLKYESSEFKCYGESTEDYKEKYGCLYSWEAAKKICPAGWHLPSYDEAKALLDYAYDNRDDDSTFLSLIAKDSAWEEYPKQGNNKFGFSAMPAGIIIDTFHIETGVSTGFWTSTASDETGAHVLYLGFVGFTPISFIVPIGVTNAAIMQTFITETGRFSVRCVKD